jgi:hypothetical protein
MGLLKREPIFVTCGLILVLATAEGWVAWHYLHGMQAEAKAERVAALERELEAKQAEINHLIFLRDSENRMSRVAVARAQARANVAVEELTADEELAEATAQAMNPPRRGRVPARFRDDHAPAAQTPSANYPLVPGFPVPSDEGDVMPAPQGAAPSKDLIEEPAAELTPADVDPKHLVNMANIMTGRHVAELTRMKGQTLIRYKTTQLREDDPIWHMLDAVQQAHVLREIVLVGKVANDASHLKKLSDTLEAGGIPSRLIHVKTADAAYKGLEGILITLSKRRNT